MGFQEGQEIIDILPKRIERLGELANNLWWSWDEDGRQVFRSLDYELWRASGHNPVKQLRDIDPTKLESASKDPAFLELYDSVISKFDGYMLRQKKIGAANRFQRILRGKLLIFQLNMPSTIRFPFTQAD